MSSMNMKVEVDHMELLQFSRTLRQVAANIESQTHRATKQLANYKHHHQDEKYDNLHQQLSKNYQSLLKSTTLLEDYAQHLDKLAEPLKEYHNIKI